MNGLWTQKDSDQAPLLLNTTTIEAMRAPILVWRDTRLRLAETARLNLMMRWASLLPLWSARSPAQELVQFSVTHLGLRKGDALYSAIQAEYVPLAQSNAISESDPSDLELKHLPPTQRLMTLVTKFQSIAGSPHWNGSFPLRSISSHFTPMEFAVAAYRRRKVVIFFIQRSDEQVSLKSSRVVAIRTVLHHLAAGDSGLRIAALHGHCYPVELSKWLEPFNGPEDLYHGTWTDLLPSIAAEGLRSDASQPGRSCIRFCTKRGQLGAVPGKGASKFTAWVKTQATSLKQSGLELYWTDGYKNSVICLNPLLPVSSVPPGLLEAAVPPGQLEPVVKHLAVHKPGIDVVEAVTCRYSTDPAVDDPLFDPAPERLAKSRMDGPRFYGAAASAGVQAGPRDSSPEARRLAKV